MDAGSRSAAECRLPFVPQLVIADDGPNEGLM